MDGATFWREDFEDCSDAEYIRQAGGTCYYYAILIPLFWSRTGRKFLGLVIDELGRSGSSIFADIAAHMEPARIPDLLDKYASNRSAGPTGSVEYLQHTLAFRTPELSDGQCRAYFEQMTRHAAKLLENKVAFLRCDYPDLYRLFQTHGDLSGVPMGHVTHGGMCPVNRAVVSSDGSKWQTFVTYKAGRRSVVGVKYGGTMAHVFDMFVAGLASMLGSRFRHALKKYTWCVADFRGGAVENLLGLVLESRTHVVPLIMCRDRWYAFNNWRGSSHIPFRYADLRELEDDEFMARHFPSVHPVDNIDSIYAEFDPPLVADRTLAKVVGNRLYGIALVLVLTAVTAAMIDMYIRQLDL